MSFAAITLCVTSQLVFITVRVYFVIDSVRELLVTPSCFISVIKQLDTCMPDREEVFLAADTCILILCTCISNLTAL
jgi:hypothetical protein